MIRIITDYQGPTGGDCTSYAKCHFQVNPTLADFMDYILTTRKGEWGMVDMGNKRIAEYKHGEIVSKCSDYDQLLPCTIALKNRSGGWSRMDYEIYFV